MPSENQIRDAIAADPSVLEDGLRTIATEYRLRNSSGTRGQVDILARDALGNFVIIELKRSKNASGRALHELFKYTALFAREKGLGPSNVRCILVSTIWDELRVPFDAYAASSDYDAVGIQIDVDPTGHVVRAELMERLTAVPGPGLTPVHLVLMYWSAETRDAAWSEVSGRLSEIGCHDHVAIAMDRTSRGDDVDFALYLALGRTRHTQALAAMSDDVPDDSVEAPDGCVWEYRAVCKLVELYRGADHIQHGYPDRFAQMTDQSRRWIVGEVFRSGRFVEQVDLVEDEELVEQVGGYSVATEVAVRVATTPRRPVHWRAAVDRIRRCLAPAPDWHDKVSLWLSELDVDELADLEFVAWNPANILGTVVNTLTGGGESMPRLEALVRSNGEPVRVIHGTLAYIPSQASCSLRAAVDEIYDGDLFNWGIAHVGGQLWQFDTALCDLTGLEYVVAEFLPNEDAFHWLRLDRDDQTSLMRLPETARDERGQELVVPLPDWIDENEADLTWVIAQFAEFTTGVFPGIDSQRPS